MAKRTAAWLKRFREDARTALATRVDRNRATLADYQRPEQWTTECPEVSLFLVLFPRALHHATIQCVLDSGPAGLEALAFFEAQWQRWSTEVAGLDPEEISTPSLLFNLRKCHAAKAALAILTGGDPTPSLEAGGAVFQRFVQWDEDYADMLSGEEKPDDSFLEVLGSELVRRLLLRDDEWVRDLFEQTLRLDVGNPDTKPVVLLLKHGYLLARERLVKTRQPVVSSAGSTWGRAPPDWPLPPDGSSVWLANPVSAKS